MLLSHLRNDFQPGIDFDTGETFAHSMAYIVMVTIFEPEREQPQSVLQRVFIAQSN